LTSLRFCGDCNFASHKGCDFLNLKGLPCLQCNSYCRALPAQFFGETEAPQSSFVFLLPTHPAADPRRKIARGGLLKGISVCAHLFRISGPLSPAVLGSRTHQHCGLLHALFGSWCTDETLCNSHLKLFFVQSRCLRRFLTPSAGSLGLSLFGLQPSLFPEAVPFSN